MPICILKARLIITVYKSPSHSVFFPPLTRYSTANAFTVSHYSTLEIKTSFRIVLHAEHSFLSILLKISGRFSVAFSSCNAIAWL